MNYYGNTDVKRICYVAMYDTKDIENKGTAIGFIKSMDRLFDYSIEHFENYEVHMYKNGKAYKTTTSTNPIIDYTDSWMGLKKKKFRGERYYYGYINHNGKEVYVVMKELPKIANDDVFHWKNNIKYGTKEAVISQGLFEYQIIAKADGNVCIDVGYKKCDNKHRTKVTIARINALHANNKDILDAIKEWRKTFSQELINAA